MSNLAQFFSGVLSRTPTSIVHGGGTGATGLTTTGIPGITVGPVASNNAKNTLSGALTAGVLKTMLNITGAGSLNFIAASSVDATARNLRVKITLDGTVVFDNAATSGLANSGLIAVGAAIGTTVTSTQWIEVPFNASCLVEIASSLTETDKVNFQHAYILR